jgi:uncharacterized membrane protein HdeD (DUF308 family)
MKFLANKLVVGIVCIIVGILILPFIGLPAVLAWIIGIILIIYGVLVLMGKK